MQQRKVGRPRKEKPETFQPCSEKQKMVLLDDDVDILLTGGGEQSASTVKTTL